MALLDVDELSVTFSTPDGPVQAVRGVSLSVDRGETLAIVGESGSGKSVTTQTVVGLTCGAQTTGRALFDGVDLLSLPEVELRRLRGRRIGMIFQDPQSCLHPFYRVGWQICEMLQAHSPISTRSAWDRAAELLDLVGVPDARQRVHDYPHQFSGGMRQRVMIAMAIALEPDLLIADEPTTALDVTVQAQVLSLLRDLQQTMGMALILISHDLGVVGNVADRVAVMYAGHIVEQGSRQTVFDAPAHPYTTGLLASMPGRAGRWRARLDSIPGQPPSMLAPPEGCAFHPRCALASAACVLTEPPIVRGAEPSHEVRCLRADPAWVDLTALDGGAR